MPHRSTLVAIAGAFFLAGTAGLAQYSERQEARPLLTREDDSYAAEAAREPIAVEHYRIDAELIPQTHEIKAKAEIRFQAQETVSSARFELNNNLLPTNITDEKGQTLSARRIADSLTIDVSLREPLAKDKTATIVFEYQGILADAQFSPVEGVQLAYIGEEGSYLLYPARWFPLSGYATNRYTAELHLKVPAGFQVVSGGEAKPPVQEANATAYSFSFARPQFPGSLAVVSRQPEMVNAEGLSMKVYFSPEWQEMARAYGEAAARMVNFFSSKFGPPPVASLSIVEIDDRSLGGYAGAEMIFLSPRAIGNEVNVRLLAQEVAQQWWRGLVSPATPADLWLDHGMATYSEALYLEHLGGAEALEGRMKEMSIDALTNDTVPIRGAGRLPEFSPEYKTILYDKAGVVLHMLRWFLGDETFFRALQEFANQFAFQTATTEDLRKILEQTSSQELGAFFIQWMDSTGASDFKADYVVYRVGSGYKIVGKIEQDRDVFSMPIEVQVQTDGQPVTQRVLVSGREAEFSMETPERPRKVVLDPNQRILKLNDTIRVQVAVARGEQALQRRDFTAALEEYQKALDVNRTSSLSHYRVGEVFFQMRNYQSAANAFRQALNGDLDPKWTEVWSHIYLGRIFDVTGQRDRAINEYQQAVRTRDNSQGALDEANRYLQAPYQLGG
ncbi:MAG: peptidase M1 [Acidobacteria bacterium]|nr:peptidase M1 [Acidobacteriota bacterium]